MSERKLTNDEHVALWDEEVVQYLKDQPSPRKKLAMLVFLSVVSLFGLVLLCSGIVLVASG